METPSNSVCSDLLRLTEAVDVVARESGMDTARVHAALMDDVTREIGWFVARLRLAAQERRALAEETKAITEGAG